MGQVVQLRPDSFRPQNFNNIPQDAVATHADFILATSLLERAQAIRQTIVHRGAPLERHERLRLLEAIDALAGGPP